MEHLCETDATLDGSRYRVLLLEHCPSNAELESLVLRLAGFYVDCCGSARDALRLLEVYAYNALVLDLELPDMDGVQLIRQLRNQPETGFLPIIVVTGRALPRERAAAVAAGCHEYITKPICTRSLSGQVARAIRRAGFYDPPSKVAATRVAVDVAI